MLPPLIAGRDKACFGVTEPDAGLNTTEIKTRAEQRGDRYVVNGTKIWTSTAQEANKILLLARTTPLDRVKRRSHGLTLFYTDLDRAHAEVRLIRKMGRHAVDSNMVFFEDMEIPEDDRIGAEGEGFRAILHGLNPERILIAAEAIGIGRVAAGPRQPLRARARGVRPPDRPEPGDPASARAQLGRAGSRATDDAEGRLGCTIPARTAERRRTRPNTSAPRPGSAPPNRR